MEKRIFYGINDPDQLDCTDLGECIGDYLDGLEWEEWPAVLIVKEYTATEVPETFLDQQWYLDKALEVLDEEFGDPDGDPSEPTPAMEAAEREFARVVRAEYTVWTCNPTGVTHEIDPVEWAREFAPELLPEEAFAGADDPDERAECLRRDKDED